MAKRKVTVLTVEGVEFQGMTAAGWEFGISPKAVIHRLRSPTFPGWKSKNHSKEKLKRKPRKRSIRTPFGVFPTLASAAEAEETTPGTINARLRSSRWSKYICSYLDKDPLPEPTVTLACMTCGSKFESWDRRRNRMCRPCRSGVGLQDHHVYD